MRNQMSQAIHFQLVGARMIQHHNGAMLQPKQKNSSASFDYL
jgi:hypothetical protein